MNLLKKNLIMSTVSISEYKRIFAFRTNELFNSTKLIFFFLDEYLFKLKSESEYYDIMIMEVPKILIGSVYLTPN